MSYQRARDDLKFLNEINTLFADNFVDVYTKPLHYFGCLALCFDENTLKKIRELCKEKNLNIQERGSFFPLTLVIEK